MLALIGIILLFGGIGYTFEAMIAGAIHIVLPSVKKKRNLNNVKNGVYCTFAGIGILLLAL